ncbi:MAG: arginase [Gammaproteobacteria bacterium]
MAFALWEGPGRTGAARQGLPRRAPYPAKPVGILGAASAIGACDKGCRLGPDSLRAVDLAGALRARGVAARWDDVIRRPESERLANDRLRLRDFCRDLAAAVGAVLRRRLRPVVVGGDHSCAIATWSAVRETLPGPLGLVWIDAHMDSHTPETSQSGALHGMPLAVLLGHGAPELTGLDPPGPKVLPQHVCLLGVRSFETAEAALLERLGVRVITMRELRRRGFAACLDEAIAIAGQGTAVTGFSLDLDALDPADAPGVGTPVAGGLRAREFVAAVTGLAGRMDPIAIEIAELNPLRDRDGKTTTLVAEILAVALGD